MPVEQEQDVPPGKAVSPTVVLNGSFIVSFVFSYVCGKRLDSHDPSASFQMIAEVAYKVQKLSGESRVLRDTITSLSKCGNPVLVVNFKRSAVPRPESLSVSEDLLAHAPEVIRERNSLHLVRSCDVDDWNTLIDNILSRGMLIVLFSRHDLPVLRDGLKVYWAWYGNPRTLEMQFERGSDFLAKSLMTGVDAVLVQTTVAGDWTVYFPPETQLPLSSARNSNRIV